MEFAMRCDLTRVISFMLGSRIGPGPMPWIGIGDDYHELTHRMGEAGVPEQVAQCILWEVQQIAAFIQRLKAIPEGSHTVLYNTSFLVTSDVGEGGPHNHDNLPVLLAGNGGGAFALGKTPRVCRGRCERSQAGEQTGSRHADPGACHSQYQSTGELAP